MKKFMTAIVLMFSLFCTFGVVNAEEEEGLKITINDMYVKKPGFIILKLYDKSLESRSFINGDPRPGVYKQITDILNKNCRVIKRIHYRTERTNVKVDGKIVTARVIDSIFFSYVDKPGCIYKASN